MKSGTISRRELRQGQPSRPPIDYLPLLAVCALVVMGLVWIAGKLVFDGPAAVAGPTAVLVADASPSPTPTLQPVPTRPPTPSPSRSPVPTPTQSLPPTVTLSPSPPPTPVPTAPPTPVPAAFAILAPADGTVLSAGGVVVEGVATPGAPITWDRPLWFDGHTVADASGRWSFVIGLNLGENFMTFRVGDDVTTARTITVTYRP